MEIVLEEQLARVRLAQKLWRERVKPEEVVHDLEQWHCGTQSCFGGHVVSWPEFQALGVCTYGIGGAPLMQMPAGMGLSKSIVRQLSPDEVAYLLFGDEHIFAPRYNHPMDADWDQDIEPIPDHQVVLERLAWAENRLVRIIAKQGRPS